MALSIYEVQLRKCLKPCRKETPVCSEAAPILAKLEGKWFFHFDEFLYVAKLKKDASHRRLLICDQEAGFNKSSAH